MGLIDRLARALSEPYREVLVQVLQVSQQQMEVTSRLVALQERVLQEGPAPKRREIQEDPL